jgi:hypothetical protein
MTIIFRQSIGTFAPPIIARAQAARYGKPVSAKELNFTRRLEWTIRGDMKLQICYEVLEIEI